MRISDWSSDVCSSDLKVGVTPNTIHRYECGEISPSEESLALLASALSFPKSFFLGADLDKPRRANASFRGLASKSARVMDAALASGEIGRASCRERVCQYV